MSVYNSNTGYTKITTSVDIGSNMVTKDYLLDLYPSISNIFKQSGLWLWGDNNSGQLGINNNITRTSPVQTISGGTDWKQVAAGGYHTSVIKTDGTLWSWGQNGYGQLGDNTITHRSSPVQTVAGGTNWKQVACGYRHTVAIKTDGTLWGWGKNTDGQLGDNSVPSIANKSSPVQTVSAGSNWKLVACGWNNTFAIKTDGTLWGWGNNFWGALGDNSTQPKSSPVQTVSGGTDWKKVAAGNFHTVAIKTDGTLWVWGGGGTSNFGQLGNNTIVDKSSPVQTVSTGTNWKMIAAGGYHTAAIKTDGTLWLWGKNSYGNLGDNTNTHKSSPVQTVAGGTNWKQVACGVDYSFSVKTDGTLWGWGKNLSGQLGDDNQYFHKSSPVQTVASGSNWKQSSCGFQHMTCIRDDSSDLYGDTV